MSKDFNSLDNLTLEEKRTLLAELLRKKGSGAKTYPLSFAQEGLWFLEQLQPGNTAYNLSAAYRLRGALDIDALRRALDEVVRRHESLRTSFRVEQGRPVQ